MHRLCLRKQTDRFCFVYPPLTLNAQRDEAIALVSRAIQSGIFNDLGSGSNVDVAVITKSGTEMLRNYQTPVSLLRAPPLGVLLKDADRTSAVSNPAITSSAAAPPLGQRKMSGA